MPSKILDDHIIDLGDDNFLVESEQKKSLYGKYENWVLSMSTGKKL